MATSKQDSPTAPRCKPGQRAMIIHHGLNAGRIVLVVRAHRPGDWFEGAPWPYANLHPWVIESLGTPFTVKQIGTGKVLPSEMRFPINDAQLMPLPDEHVMDESQDAKPKRKSRKEVH